MATDDTKLAPIAADEALPLPMFRERTGLDEWALREARKKGLKTVTVGRRKFVLGRHWLEFLESQAKENGDSTDQEAPNGGA